jgi:translation initiation factor 2B subunit (eIF-2B alpha/beta/delta family)
MDDLTKARIARLAVDTQSGASRLAAQAVEILQDVWLRGGNVPAAAAAVVRAQPSMASVWNAAIEAVASAIEPGRLERFAARLDRSGTALARFAAGCFDEEPSTPLRVVTISSSRAVELVCGALDQRRGVSVACTESRPGLEGRTLATRLAAAGIGVVVYSDAAIGQAIPHADVVLLGADAVRADAFLNKSGSRMLVAAAAQAGVPVYVAATRDKFAGRSVAGRITIREGAPDEIWDAPPAAVTVRNPYFEWTSLDSVSAAITDVGVLGAGMVADVCRSVEDAVARQALEAIAEQLR